MSVFDEKLEDHLEDHRQQETHRARRVQGIVTVGMILSPLVSSVTTYFLTHHH